jgi:putative hydrolase of the HAD superfamily
MKYKAVIFDLFGTLVPSFSTREYRQVVQKMATLVSAPPETFWRMWISVLDESLLGIIPGPELKIKYLCQKLGVPVEENRVLEAGQMFMAYETLNMVVRPGAVEVITQLKSRGLKIGLITDCSSEGVILWKETPLAPLFDTAVFSCTAGLRKPDPRIYQMAADGLKVPLESCIYIGDGGSNELSGASRVGMKAVQLKMPGESDPDVYRVNQEGWDGTVITDLEEVLSLAEPEGL